MILWVESSDALIKVDLIFATKSTTDAAQYALERANMNRVIPKVNILLDYMYM